MSVDDNIPKWISAKLFEQVLKENVENFKNIKSFKVKQALAPGENYASVVLKVNIDCVLQDGRIKDQSYILKVAHDNELYRTELWKWNLFGTESGMYRHIVPDFENIYRQKGLDVKFGALAYELPTSEEYILLEDLSRRGFRNVNRQDCLDMNHCKAVLKKQAQFHAASVIWLQQNGPFPELYTQGLVHEDGKALMASMLNSGFKHVLKTIKDMDLDDVYYQELKQFGDHLVDTVFEQTKLNENDFNVLNHGDCWSNNIMFQYAADGSLNETYFIDLQLPHYGSPAQDLIYFILSSSQYELKIKRFDDMIRYYYDQLIQHLKILEYSKPLPSLRDIHQMIIKSGIWGIVTILITMAAVLCDKTDSANVDNFVGDSEDTQAFKEILFSNDRFKKHLEIVIPWLCNRGGFEL